MIVQMYAVFDSAVGVYGNPFCCRSRGEAVRSFEIACQDDKLPFKGHPAHFRLFFLGAFDDQSGGLEGLRKPEAVIGADEFA